jgi:hypothetical protein
MNGPVGQDMDAYSILKRVEEFARSNCNDPTDHPSLWSHLVLARKYAAVLAATERADHLVVEAAAVLHDIGKSQGRHDHHLRSVEICRGFLKDIGLPPGTQAAILECILKHRSRHTKQNNPIEVRVLQSADALAVLFDDPWQEHCRGTMAKGELLRLYKKALNRITLQSARRIAQPQVSTLESLLH